jgi:hypothetical protein
MTAYNEGPVFLLLNPAIDASRKDLPVDVYETGACGGGTGCVGLLGCMGGSGRGHMCAYV